MAAEAGMIDLNEKRSQMRTDLNDKMSKMHHDIGVLTAVFAERKDTIDKNARNIGEAFTSIREGQAAQTAMLHEIRSLAERVNLQETRLVTQEGVIMELKQTVNSMRETVIKSSLVCTIGTAMVTGTLMKFFGG
ncbi:MAG: hypothetical protein LBT40_12505 [Deltaproteobacteria bacterium]|jgi:hypothetical protein|nr:hypothetical protein [Deltaproteobacteria bacterium]